MYPKPLIEALKQHNPAWITGSSTPDQPFGFSFSPDIANTFEVEDFLIHNEQKISAISEYFDYMRLMRDGFRRVAEHCGYVNESSSHSLGHDRWSVGWSGDLLLPLASTLYMLKSYGVTGDMMECGAFKGSSTACLSQACQALGVTLYCADSFEGLPSDELHYCKGDFCGSLDEVKRNVELHGQIDSVSFIKGFYAESLRNFDRKLCLLWVDVDLKQSTLDVLNNVFPCINPDGVIFTDGCPADRNIRDGKFVHIGCEPAGFYDFFKQNGTDYIVEESSTRGIAMVTIDPARRPGLTHYPERFLHFMSRI